MKYNSHFLRIDPRITAGFHGRIFDIVGFHGIHKVKRYL